MNDTPKQKRVRLSSDTEMLKKLVSILESEKLTKQTLAEKLGLTDAKQISDKVLLAAVKFAGNAQILSNIVEKTTKRSKKGPEYSKKKGLLIPAWIFEDRTVEDGQQYDVELGRKGIIHLRPKN